MTTKIAQDNIESSRPMFLALTVVDVHFQQSDGHKIFIRFTFLSKTMFSLKLKKCRIVDIKTSKTPYIFYIL